MFDEFLLRYPYWTTVTLMLIGLYGMLVKRNLVKKLIGMNIMQTAIILFFISTAVRVDEVDGKPVPATIPIIVEHDTHGAHDAHAGHEERNAGAAAVHYVNPLPHVLMLTAIVVSVATSGVALALLVLIYRRYETLDEPTLLARLRET